MGKQAKKFLKDADKHLKPYKKDANKAYKKACRDLEKSGNTGLVIIGGVLVTGVLMGSALRKKKCDKRHHCPC